MSHGMIRDGYYGFEFVQERNFGFGVLVFDRGRISGVDVGGACYDGTYAVQGTGQPVDVALTVTIPADVASIFGTRHDHAWSFNLETKLEPDADTGELVLRSPAGTCLQASYRYMRALPAA